MPTTAELTENSRQGLEPEKADCIGFEGELSRNLHWGCGHVYDETPVDLVVYVRNDPVNKVDPDGRFAACWSSPGNRELGIPPSVECLNIDPPDSESDLQKARRANEKDSGKPPCAAQKRRFFDWLSEPLTGMAKDLNVDRDFLFALAAKEGGWNKEALDHNIPLNNPFGVNKIENGKAVGNKDYGSDITNAIKDWESLFGDRVRGAKSMEDFIKGLQDPGGGRKPYNSADPQWAEVLGGLYKNSVPRYKEACNVE